MAYTGRFAPSPTGPLHLGGARTALLAWARARAAGGRFLLRIEDLDAPRVRAGAEAALLQDLAWLGLDWDEPPMRQSGRGAVYAAALQRLKASGKAFACSCTRRDLAASASAPHDDDGPRYPGACRQGPQHPGRPLAWRFRMDPPETVVDGRLGVQAPLADDFVLQRADGVFSYQLACAVDDAEQGVTEAVRAEDLLPSAARQASLLKALGRTPPHWYHVPLVLGADGQRLSKRHASSSIAELRAQGRSAEAINGWMAASLGLAEPGASLPAAAWPRLSERPLRPQPLPLPG